MREIKFRAWDGEKMLQGQDVMNLTLGQMLTWSDRLMQYIGLKDKNGVEIYEGDIVDMEWDSNFYGPSEFTADEVSDTYRKVIGWDDKSAGFSLKTYTNFKVIGNVHENPDLLK